MAKKTIVANLVDANTSCKRYEDFLAEEDFIPLEHVVNSNQSNTAVSVKNASFAFASNSNCFLKDLNFELNKNSLTCVIGKIGSGKSALLLALLKEMEKVEGEVKICGKIAYCAQMPWIKSTTIRENITVC